MTKVVRIGGASGALNDSAIAVPQLLAVPGMNYLAFDYLGEGAMGLFARMKAANPASGFMTDFIDVHIGPHFAALKRLGVKVVSNAGGMNPEGPAQAIRDAAARAGVALTVAAVTGDDVMPLLPDLAKSGLRDMFSGAAVPPTIGSANAYLGAFPIAAALARGADVVVTGRIVDSAMILGPLIHEFGWTAEDYDLLAAGTAAGHLLECGAQATGGTFTDWQDVPDWANIGFPYAECHADGSFVLTKPEGSGGLVGIGTVGEQLLYEVSDPQRYFVPDVTCDFAGIALDQVGPDRVRVTGAKGYPPTDSYKVSCTYDDGWRSIGLFPIIGTDAVAKARRTADAVLERTGRMLRERNLAPFRATHVEVIGTEASYGPHARALAPREVLCKIVADHDEMAATDLFWREQSAAIMNMAVGTSISPIIATPRSIPLSRLTSFLIAKDRVEAEVSIAGDRFAVPVANGGGFADSLVPAIPPQAEARDGEASVPLVALAWVRSGDKGNLFNLGVIARAPEHLPHLRASLTEEAVGAWFAHLFADPAQARVERFEAPGFHALNFVVHEAQGSGISSSPRLDPAAKSMGQLMLDMPVAVPRALAQHLGTRASAPM